MTHFHNQTSSRLLNLGLLGAWMAKRRNIWQMRLLNARDLAQFARDRRINFSNEDIVCLWQLRLLRADLVTSNRKLRQIGLIDVGTDDHGRHLYADERHLRTCTKEWVGAAEKFPELPSGMEPLFHPFRYYVLYHLNRTLELLHVSPMQKLFSKERYYKILDLILSSFQQSSASESFVQAIEHCNDVTALAVATEPCIYERIFGMFYCPVFIDEETQRKLIAEHWNEIAKCYQQVSIEQVEKARQDLCMAAELLDPNCDVHTMLRLAEGELRLKLKGQLGGAVLLRTIAETLRRATEKACDVTLREEDVLGFGWMPPDLKERLYGSNRIFDSNRNVANEFMRRFGFDYGLRLRWYVEGNTEWGALRSILERPRWIGIEVINLRGQVAQRGGRGLTFRESLRADLKGGIFSFVSIDGDRSDYLHAVRKAAKDDEICGMFFVSEPDFALGNFDLSELEEVLWNIAIENGVNPNGRSKLHRAIKATNSEEELLKAARTLPELARVTKGEQWGERLMRFAWERPERPDGTMKPVVEAVDEAFRSLFSSHHQIRSQLRVDPQNGKLVERHSGSC